MIGTVLGVGGSKPAPIPKFDEKNNVTGYWDKEEVGMRYFATFGVNRKTQSVLEMEEGYHGRNAPHGNNPAEAEEAHLSALDATHLAALAHQTGLEYSTFRNRPVRCLEFCNASQFATWQPSIVDLRPWLAILCFVSWRCSI